MNLNYQSGIHCIKCSLDFHFSIKMQKYDVYLFLITLQAVNMGC